MEKFLVYALFFVVFSTIPILVVWWLLRQVAYMNHLTEEVEEEEKSQAPLLPLRTRRCCNSMHFNCLKCGGASEREDCRHCGM